jgi:hypothetical protein
MESALLAAFIFLALSVHPAPFLGRIVLNDPTFGIALLCAGAAMTYAGLRIWTDGRRSRAQRRWALAGAAGSLLVTCALATSAYCVRAYNDWQKWFDAGAGLKAGMTVEEAKHLLQSKSRIIRIDVGTPGQTQFLLQPAGLLERAGNGDGNYFEIGREMYAIDASIRDDRLETATTWSGFPYGRGGWQWTSPVPKRNPPAFDAAGRPTYAAP